MEQTVKGLTADLAESAITQGRYADPTTGTERILAEVLADVVCVERVSVESHFFEDLGANSLVMAQFCARVRKRGDLPSVSMKDVYRYPTIRSLATALADAAPTPVESSVPASTEEVAKILAEVLADVVRVERVSVESNFFEDLGANSLVMAQFCARVRKRADLPPVSMKDVYRYPTIRSLATALADAAPKPVESSVPASTAVPASTQEVATPASTRQYVLCGTLQLLIFLGYCSLAGLVTAVGYNLIFSSSGWIDLYLRLVLFSGALFVGFCSLPIVAKWLLIGRWKADEFPVWGLTYLRFWIVKALVQANPMVFFAGTPLYVLYLRALGARIGKGVTILSPTVPVCTDQLTIGAGTLIRKDSFFLCYRAHAGRIQTGPVTLGRDVYIGEKTVLDINTSMGDGAQLGHTSALHSGQAIPDGQHWHGSPAQPTQLDYVRVAPADCGTLRRVSFGLYTLLGPLFVTLPLALVVLYILFTSVPALVDLLNPNNVAISSPELYLDALVLSLVLFFGFIIVGLAVVFSVPRLPNHAIKPDKVYPLYGFHYAMQRTIAGMTNSKFFNWLFGDSSYIIHYLRCLGYDLSLVEQTGENFGALLQHDNPYLSSIGRGTMICDGLSIINADYSSTSFRVSRASIGSHNFLGNHIAFPSGARTGDNCLLATRAMIPLDGKVREGVGLLGSPCFEIPRSVERDSRFDHLRTGDELRRRLAAKNRYNLRTIGLFLLIRWLLVFALMVLILAAVNLYHVFGPVTFAADMALSLVFSVAYFLLVDWAMRGFRALRPQICSIYDPYYWWHERYWKVPDEYLNLFNGTPFKNVIQRLMGVRLGRRVFDDGCSLTERTLATIGNDCTLNAGSVVQTHSMEDFTFKSDHSTFGAGCTLGVGAHIHYGVTMGDGAVLEANSFLMKGEEVPAHAWWGGNPARALAGYRAASVMQAVPAQPLAHHAPSPGRQGPWDHGDERAQLDGHHTAAVMPVGPDSNDHGGACRPGQRGGAP
ncbi:MAG TPA: Pls/PosA family non-ribosomal peptide synthetase [Chloroflexota bacterium]